MPKTITIVSATVILVAAVASPGAAAAEPASTTDLLSDLRTEEVLAGVFRVVGDEFRDLPTGAYSRVEAGLDGSVWLLSGYEALRLGRERSVVLPVDDWQAELRGWRPTPEGGLSGWASSADEAWFVASFDEPGSHPRIVPLDDGLEPYAVMPDGRAWAQRVGDAGWVYSLWRLLGEEWTEVATGLDGAGPQVTADGELWLGSDFVPFGTPELRRFDGEDWTRFVAPERPPYEGWTVGADGSVWTWAHYRIAYPDSAFLARLKDGTWTSWERDELPAFADMQPGIDTTVAPDGALWVGAPVWASSAGDMVKRCRGVARFDGVTLTAYLGDHCVRSLSIGPDGAVWLLANEAGGQGAQSQLRPLHTYVILPTAITETR